MAVHPRRLQSLGHALGCNRLAAPHAAPHAASRVDGPSLTTLLPAGVPLQPTGGGHTHPNIAVTQDGTIVVVCAAVLDDSTPGKDCLVCFRSTDGHAWSGPYEVPPSHFKPVRPLQANAAATHGPNKAAARPLVAMNDAVRRHQ